MTKTDIRLMQDALAAFARRDFASAKRLADAVRAANPVDPNAAQILGLIALEEGDPAAAKAHLLRALAVAADHTRILNALGVAHRRLGEIDAARRVLTRAAATGDAESWRNLGNLEDAEKRHDAAIEAYENAVARAPRDAAALGALADLYERRHDLARAKAHAQSALSINPLSARAAVALARVRLREQDFAGAEAVAKPLAEAQNAARANRAIAWGLIGEARDRLGDAPAAFSAFTTANALQLEDHAVLRDASAHLYHPDSVRRMLALADEEGPAGGSFQTPAPVFLVGFPRSGTTLLDQILASHPDIACVEEEPHFAAALVDALGDSSRLFQPSHFSHADIAAARTAYWRRSGISAPRVIDKLPLNIVVLPLIRRVFPDAKIIVALRDPRDVILSCYQQRFGMNAAMVQFLDLETAAAYYDLVMTLCLRCRERLGAALLEVRYESVVADLEGQARRLAGFLDVPFDPAMIDFQKTARTRDIATPSARQVIEPLYARSIGRWRRYANELAPALTTLNAWAVRLGYRD